MGSASLSVLNISVMSALADIADENAAKFGLRQEGILYAARAFFAKADRAIGTLIAGIVLDLISFQPKLFQVRWMQTSLCGSALWTHLPLLFRRC